MLRWHVTIVSMVALWLLANVVSYAEEQTTAKSELCTGEAAIEEALSKPATLDFNETPLSDVIEFLKDANKIEICLDNRALGDVGIGSDTPVTFNLAGVTLRSALNLMLRELNLTWIIKDEVLLITTPEEAEVNLKTKVYDVSDLVACVDKNDEPWDDYDTLIDFIATTTRPTTWDDVGGPGSITGMSLGTAKVLVVGQTHEVHRELNQLLTDIRAVAAKHPDGKPPRRNPSESKRTPEKPYFTQEKRLPASGSPSFDPFSLIPKPTPKKEKLEGEKKPGE